MEAIKADIRWLGFEWNDIFYASDYFQQLYDFAIDLIKRGHAYVEEQTSEQIVAQKGGRPLRPVRLRPTAIAREPDLSKGWKRENFLKGRSRSEPR